MSRMQETSYSPQWLVLLEPMTSCPLDAGTGDVHRRAQLESFDLNSLFAPQKIRDREMAECCLAGAWLLFNYLDESHSISQQIHTREGSYWHGIMHRREGDFGNSKYWFRQAGVHVIFGDLHEQVTDYLSRRENNDARLDALSTNGVWSPDVFVDLCATALGNSSQDVGLIEPLQEIAMIEWRLLFDHCYQHAIH